MVWLATIKHQIISIKNIGVGKDYTELKEKVDKFQKFEDKIKISYSEADPIIINKQIKNLKDEIEKLEESKKHKAWQLNEKIKYKNQLINTMPDEDLITDLNGSRTLSKNIKEKKEFIEKNKDKVKNHNEFLEMD